MFVFLNAKSKMAKKAAGSKKPAASHPTYAEMVRKAIGVHSHFGRGASRQKIAGYISSNFTISGNLTVCALPRARVVGKQLSHSCLSNTQAAGQTLLPGLCVSVLFRPGYRAKLQGGIQQGG